MPNSSLVFDLDKEVDYILKYNSIKFNHEQISYTSLHVLNGVSLLYAEERLNGYSLLTDFFDMCKDKTYIHI